MLSIFFCSSFHERIRHVLKGVLHERSDVRGHALKALHKLLKSNRVRIHQQYQPFCIVCGTSNLYMTNLV